MSANLSVSGGVITAAGSNTSLPYATKVLSFGGGSALSVDEASMQEWQPTTAASYEAIPQSGNVRMLVIWSASKFSYKLNSGSEEFYFDPRFRVPLCLPCQTGAGKHLAAVEISMPTLDKLQILEIEDTTDS